MAQWLDGTVLNRKDWNDHLFSLEVDCPAFDRFIPGQFVKVGIEQADGKILSRPYSLVNAPHQTHLEILAVPVEEGSLSPKLHELATGNSIKIMSPATGFLTLSEVPDGESLWCLATGTGVGPFVSIFRQGEVWEQYKNVVLLYAARYENDLAYRDELLALAANKKEQFRLVTVVSRESHPEGFEGRIPTLLAEGAIQERLDLPISADASQIMLCGNPAMIQDALVVLENMGLKKHLRRSPGQITLERYW